MCFNSQLSRLLGFRHNPYVGTFHRINYIPYSSEVFGGGLIVEPRKNPLVGLLRHSPSVLSKCKGLKGIFADGPKSPVLSRISFGEKGNHNPSKNFVTSLREIPHSVYSSVSSSGVSVTANNAAEDTYPTCAICRMPYSDGDALLTLGCSHCYHSECVSRWFYHDCLNSVDMTSNFRCPQCRQSHIESSEASTLGDDGIAATSLLKIGQRLVEEGGYNLLNDVDGGSDTSSYVHKIERPSKSLLLESRYSDCGYPLI